MWLRCGLNYKHNPVVVFVVVIIKPWFAYGGEFIDQSVRGTFVFRYVDLSSLSTQLGVSWRYGYEGRTSVLASSVVILLHDETVAIFCLRRRAGEFINYKFLRGNKGVSYIRRQSKC